MVKNFFDPVSAGLYIGAATIGKMIIFGTGSVVLVMFPQISSLNAKSIDYKNKFWILTTIQVLLVLVALTAFILFPKPITLLFFGEKFSGSIHLVPKYALFASLYVVVNYFVMFFIAIDKTTVSFFLIPMAIAQIILINVYHNSLDQVVHTNIVVLSFLLICLLILLRITLKKVAFPKFN